MASQSNEAGRMDGWAGGAGVVGGTVAESRALLEAILRCTFFVVHSLLYILCCAFFVVHYSLCILCCTFFVISFTFRCLHCFAIIMDGLEGASEAFMFACFTFLKFLNSRCRLPSHTSEVCSH
jgi:hypothetical protein